MSSCSCNDAVLSDDGRCNTLAACAKGSLTALGLALRHWPNRGFAGNFVQTVVPSLTQATTGGAADDPFGPFSIEVLGTLTLPVASGPSERWVVTCESRGGSFFLWLDDHLVCEGGNRQPRWNPFRLESVVPFEHTLHARQAAGATGRIRYFLRATFVQQPERASQVLRERPYFDLRWQRTPSPPTYTWNKNRWQPPSGSGDLEIVPRAALST